MSAAAHGLLCDGSTRFVSESIRLDCSQSTLNSRGIARQTKYLAISNTGIHLSLPVWTTLASLRFFPRACFSYFAVAASCKRSRCGGSHQVQSVFFGDFDVNHLTLNNRRYSVFLCLSVLGLAGCGTESSLSLPTISGSSANSQSNPKKTLPLSKVFDLREPMDATAAPTRLIEGPVFDEVASQSGVVHQYVNGPPQLLLMVQPTGGGCGWIDYDRDGLWDLYLNQAGDPSLPRSPSQPSDQLFRNLGAGQFLQVSTVARIDERDFSQGVAVGDFDNDGFDDVIVTNAGANTLFQNQGDGTFRDVSDAALKQTNGWHSSAAWGDIDRDGDLDLYVCRYVEFDRFHPRICWTPKGVHRMCQPNEIEPTPDEMYLNRGDGTFDAVAHERGLFGPANKALGVAIADFDNDDWPDIYVANDPHPSFLFINQKDAHFSNMADVLGCAVGADGRAQAGMGIAVGDYDHNGFLDLYLTHFEGEWNTLYRNLGPQGFVDATASAGGVEITLPMVGWGTVMEDFNQDGHDDLLIANGHLDDPGHLGIELAMKTQLFSFNGLKIVDVSDHGGAYFSHRYIGRGVATADYDNDGDLDAVIVNQNAAVSLLKNNSARGHWLKLEFVGRESNRRGIGTRVVLRIGDESFMRELAGGTSYCSSNQPALVFGLGARKGDCELEVRWPNGMRQTISNVAVDQALTLVEPK